MKHAISMGMSVDGKLTVNDSRWAQLSDSFVNQELETIEIANAIYTGHCYCAWVNGRRKSENFIKSGFIAVDLDTGDARSSFDHLLTLDLVRMYAGLIHTTPSHTPDRPRARVLFFLDRPITDPEAYRQATIFWLSLFDGADPVCKDPSRFFYGAKNCEIWFSENVLPVSHMRRYYREWKQAQPVPRENIIRLDEYRPPAQTAQTDGERALGILAQRVATAPEGARNKTLVAQAFLAGKDIRTGRYTRSEAEGRLLDAARRCGLDDNEAKRAIRNGLNGAQKVATA